MRGSKVDVLAAPDVLAAVDHDPVLWAIADAISQTQAMPYRRVRSRTAALLAVAVLAVAAPAYGLARTVIDFVSSPPAPAVAIKNFADLDVGAPKGMATGVTSAQARQVNEFTLADGSAVALLVAPTRSGGFCEEYAGFAETCDTGRDNPIDLGFAAKRIPQGPAILFGAVLSDQATHVQITLSDGSVIDLPLLRVGPPINASFYFKQVDPAVTPVSGSALDSAGEAVASSWP